MSCLLILLQYLIVNINEKHYTRLGVKEHASLVFLSGLAALGHLYILGMCVCNNVLYCFLQAKRLKSVKALIEPSKTFEIKGTIAPVFTPINEEGQPEYASIPDYLTFLQKNGVKGILVGGTTGEAASFTAVERMAVFRAFRKVAINLGLKVIVQVGGASLPDVIAMAHCAEEMKADAIMTLPELYFKPQTTEQLVNYLKIVSKAAPSLPLIYYHFPMMSGVQVRNVPEFFKMASNLSNFKGMKADLEVALQVQSKLRTDQRIFIGNHMLAPAAVVGFDSNIATVTNLFPGLVESLIEVSKAGKLEKIKQYHIKLNELVAAITSHGEFLPAMKAAMPMVTGINVGAPRRPLEPLTQKKIKELHESLKKLDFGRMK